MMTYEDILNELNSLVSEGLAYVADTGSDYAVTNVEADDVTVSVEVTGNWDYQITLLSATDVYQTRRTEQAAHALHHALNDWYAQAASVEF